MPQTQLTNDQVRHGFSYGASEPDELIDSCFYKGQQELAINCTQLGPAYKSAKEKKRVLGEWCELLINNPKAFKVLKFGTRMPQELFDAVCHQQELEDLEINWCACQDLTAIENLKKLKFLSIESGASVGAVRPISRLRNLVGLYLANFQKVTDYSELTRLSNLESLSICGDGMSPRYIKVDSLDFLREMPQLRYLSLLTIRLQSKDYLPILHLRKLEHLDLGSHRDVKKVYDELCTLPELKWGYLKENPEFYTRKNRKNDANFRREHQPIHMLSRVGFGLLPNVKKSEIAPARQQMPVTP